MRTHYLQVTASVRPTTSATWLWTSSTPTLRTPARTSARPPTRWVKLSIPATSKSQVSWTRRLTCEKMVVDCWWALGRRKIYFIITTRNGRWNISARTPLWYVEARVKHWMNIVCSYGIGLHCWKYIQVRKEHHAFKNIHKAVEILPVIQSYEAASAVLNTFATWNPPKGE